MKTVVGLPLPTLRAKMTWMVGCISRDTIRSRVARLFFVVSTSGFVYCTAVVIPYTAWRAHRLGLIRPDQNAAPRLGGLWNHVSELETLVDEVITIAAVTCLFALLSRALGERINVAYLIASVLLFVVVFFEGVRLID